MNYFKLLIILLLLNTSLLANIHLTKNEKQFIKDHPVIILGAGESFAPFIMQNKDGTISGYDADIVNLIREKTGLNIQFKFDNWKKLQELAENREIDGLSTAARDGAKYYDFSNTYVQYTPMVIVNKGNPKKIHNFKDLENKTIAVQKGNKTFTRLANSLNNVSIKYYKTMHDLIRAVVSKEVDFTIIDETAFYVANEIGLKAFIEHSFAVGDTTDVVFNLRNDYPELVSIVNKGLNDITKQEYIVVKDKWITLNGNKSVDYDLIFKILCVVFAIALLVLYKQYILKKANSKLEDLVKEKTQEITRINQNLELRVIEEIEKNRKKDQQLIEQSRLAQMGEMISMIAHQWRQPISNISMGANNILLDIELDNIKKDTLRNDATNIMQVTKELSNTIDDFRNFYKPNKQSKFVKLEDVVKKSLNIIKPALMNHSIDIVEEYNSNEKIELHDREVMHVILNILKNAQESFQEKQIKNKIITIKTKNRTVSICDNAGEIPQDIIGKIFDPYFSTKNEKNGTGLGLYMSKTIIENHQNGKLSVENIENSVCFKIEF